MSAKLFVNNKDESPRIFKSDFLDFFSRVHWTAPLILWGPVLIASLIYSLLYMDLNLWLVPVVYLVAMFSWSIAEYLLHRFAFHFHPTSELGKRIHFLSHGVHHDFPNDSKRLVMPPILSIIISIPFIFLFKFTMGSWYLVFFAGFVNGYLIYDMMHYALHHATWENAIFKKLKEHHMIHHYAEPEKGFGVSTTFWDIVFRTMITRKGGNVGH